MRAAPLNTQNSHEDDGLAAFIDQTCGEGRLRVEHDYGGGFVRLRSTEAEKRQAVQDIRSTEDIVIELLRNARDAGAAHIFLAVHRDDRVRTIVAIDDGSGIPVDMHERVFEPRVTSKLDTAHMDKWGIHGRGMALYSIAVNADKAVVQASGEGRGSSFVVRTNLDELGEKADQSTFPHFEIVDGVYSMRGPRNIVRATAEFALEHRRECAVYCGSFTEISASLYDCGLNATTPTTRAFPPSNDDIALVDLLAFSVDPDDFAQRARFLGLPISDRSARRVLDGDIKPAPPMIDRIEQECLGAGASEPRQRKTSSALKSRDRRGLGIEKRDIDELSHAVGEAFDDLAVRYYLEHGDPEVRVDAEHVRITIPIRKL